MLNGVLYRLRAGITWPELPEEFGPAQQVRERQLRWWKAGLWPQIVALLDTSRGQSVAAPAALPPFKVLGELPVTSESSTASKLQHDEQDSRTLRRGG
jgi:transposase